MFPNSTINAADNRITQIISIDKIIITYFHENIICFLKIFIDRFLRNDIIKIVLNALNSRKETFYSCKQIRFTI